MNDLLTQSFEKARGQPSREEDIESGIGFSPNASDMGIFPDMGMENFFKKVKEIETQMDKITTQLHKLQAANEESKSVTKASAMKAIKERMEISIDEVGKIALKVKLALEEVDRENFASRQKPGCGKGTGIDRSRTAMTVALKKKLKERMYDFQTLRQNIHNEYREVVERRVFTVTGTQADEETIDRLIESGNSEHIFEKAIQGHGRGQILDTLAEIQERFDTVKEIEKKLLDLQQMFLDMSVLVEAQGDMLDNIETQREMAPSTADSGQVPAVLGSISLGPRPTLRNTCWFQVSSAVDHVQTATTVLQKAKKNQRNTRKYTCIAVVIFLIIIIVLVVPVSARLKQWSNNISPSPNP